MAMADGMKGSVKSTSCDRFAVMVMSATAASYTCQTPHKALARGPNEICSKSLAQTFHSEIDPRTEIYSPCSTRTLAEAAGQPVVIIIYS
jgi:hypothetical protein